MAVTEAIRSVIRSGWFLKGPHTESLEQRISDRCSGRFVTSVGNGTDALYLALKALGVDAQSRVVTVANAGGYSTGAILRCGGTPVFVDVDEHSAQMSVSGLTDVLDNADIDVVIVTHLYGLVGEIQEIVTICTEREIAVVEDCAQAFGASLGDSEAGSFGDLSTFSFYPTKNLGGFGDGGAVAARTSELHQRVRSLSQYGWSDRYSVETPGGINSRLDEIQAVVILNFEATVDQSNSVRRQIVSRYYTALGTNRQIIFSDSPRFIGHLAVIVSNTRDYDMQCLQDDGVECGVHYPIPDHLQPAWRQGFEGVSLPVTESLSKRIFTVPCFPTMTEEEIRTVESALRNLN